MRTVAAVLAAAVVLLAALAGCSAAPDPVPATAGEALCEYRSAALPDTMVFAPCAEGERFVESMRAQGFPDNDTYMPEVAADTCAKKAAGQPLTAWGSSGSAVQKAFRQAEIAARCP